MTMPAILLQIATAIALIIVSVQLMLARRSIRVLGHALDTSVGSGRPASRCSSGAPDQVEEWRA